MKETADGGEVGEALFFKDACEVKFNPVLTADEGSLAEEAELAAVGENASEVVAVVAVRLKEAVEGEQTGLRE